MAIIEEVPDSPEPSPVRSPEVEVVPEAGIAPASAPAPPSPPPETSDPRELARVLHTLSARLALPEDLLPSFLSEENDSLVDEYRAQARATLQNIAAGTRQEAWKGTTFDEQATVVDSVVRLRGEDSWTSPEICSLVDEITVTVDRGVMADHLLSSTLRTLFAAHPHLSASADRARPRPAGGAQAMDDLQASQPWKGSAGWGCHNALAWAASSIDDSLLLRRLGNLLPPTLMMMDDWEPQWRGRGAWVLQHWVSRLPPDELARRGLDKLLLSSLTHTLSLHASPPLTHVLPAALSIVKHLDGHRRADAYTDIVDKALVAGWAYAPSGAEGRAVLTDVAGTLETLCAELGTGIARWLKSIVPALLEPLQYPPSSAALPHFRANLAALNSVCLTLNGTGRISRWRGQILNIGAQLWVHLSEREYEESEADLAGEVRHLLQSLFEQIASECPKVKDEEFGELLKLNRDTFAPLVAVA